MQEIKDMEHRGSPRPWTYHNKPGGTFGRRDWIEDAIGNVVVEHVGHIDGPLIVAAVNGLSESLRRIDLSHIE